MRRRLSSIAPASVQQLHVYIVRSTGPVLAAQGSAILETCCVSVKHS